MAVAYLALRGPQTLISEGPYLRNAAHRFGPSFPCYYCPYKARSEGGRCRHILLTPSCRRADEEASMDTALRVTEPSEGEKLVAQTVIPDEKTYDGSPNCDPVDFSQDDLIRLSQSPPPTPTRPAPPIPPLSADDSGPLEYDARRQLFVERFPDPRAGAPIDDRVAEPLDTGAYMATVGNLANPDYFDTAELLMTTGLTNAGRDAHLKSRLYVGQTPWKTNKKLLEDIDKLPHGPVWDVFDIDLNERAQRAPRKHTSYLFMRWITDTFRNLISNLAFKDEIQYAPVKLWTAEDRKCRVYGKANTGKLMWNLQRRIPDKNATIILGVLATDRSTLSTMSGGQQVYPCYLTLANINKSIRRKMGMRATTLLAYLPVDKFKHVADPAERSRLRRWARGTVRRRAISKSVPYFGWEYTRLRRTVSDGLHPRFQVSEMHASIPWPRKLRDPHSAAHGLGYPPRNSLAPG
ncbi:hypothetical protein FRC09_004848 [Ceratobasidium sp. 395]|nr:hypothetical protein FRC09_004848 [Ceratobasidium sp. 395]